MDFYRQPLPSSNKEVDTNTETKIETLTIKLAGSPEEREVIAKLAEAAVPMADQRLADDVDLHLEHTATSDERATALAKAAANIRTTLEDQGKIFAQTGELHTSPARVALYRKLAIYTLGATNIEAIKKIHKNITPAETSALQQIKAAQIDEIPFATEETERALRERQRAGEEMVTV